MKKVIPKHSAKHKHKGAGRRPTGKDPVQVIRIGDEQAKAVEAWAQQQEDRPSLNAAVRPARQFCALPPLAARKLNNAQGAARRREHSGAFPWTAFG